MSSECRVLLEFILLFIQLPDLNASVAAACREVLIVLAELTFQDILVVVSLNLLERKEGLVVF